MDVLTKGGERPKFGLFPAKMGLGKGSCQNLHLLSILFLFFFFSWKERYWQVFKARSTLKIWFNFTDFLMG